MPEKLGRTLKKAREQKQLSIEETSEKTRIPKKIIRAIEEDRLNEISSAFYTRGFIRTYSKFLGAEEEKAIKEYLTGPEKKKEEPRLLLDNERVPGEWIIKYRKKAAIALLAVCGIWVLGLGVIQVKKFISNSAARYKAYVNTKRESKKERKMKEQAPLAKIEGIELEISSRVNTLIKVRSEDGLLFTGILKKGASDTWRAKKEINLDIGNAGGITLKLNGKDLGYLGKKGEKKSITVTKDGILDKFK